VFKPPNDVLVHGKKISGSAQRHQKNIVLIHGTILVSTNLDLMQQVLVNTNKKTVTTLEKELHNPPTMKEVKHQLITEFEDEFQTQFKTGTFTPDEYDIITHLIKNRYSQENWTYAR
jgi:lipoate-protein ligase A